ncbi:enoyl-CoA hydratase [Pseudohaliea sp.]|uniref:enoyl-CoA hydratase n=1 Tax=Pseudohaliea sp. TaxID=2740289 RepID=UPI0032ECAEEB
MELKTTTYRVEDRVAVLTLSRPDQRNAWNADMNTEVRQLMARAVRDQEVRVIVLTGAGESFCVGADMAAAAAGAATQPATSDNDAEAFSGRMSAGFSTKFSYFPRVQKPVIAAINGACAGLGLVLALYCDIRFAASDARFSTAFSRRGLVAEHGVGWLLPRIAGPSNAADLLLSGRKFDGDEAARLGLVNRAVSPGDLMGEVMSYASDIAANVSPRAMREIKRQLWSGLEQELREAIDDADTAMAESLASEDFREGVAHFREKRQARFRGITGDHIDPEED